MSKTLRTWLVPTVIFTLLIVMQIIYISLFFEQNLASDIGYVTISSVGAVVFSMTINFLFIRYIEDSNKLYEAQKEEEIRVNLEHLNKRYLEIAELEIDKSRQIKKSLLEKVKRVKLNIESGQPSYSIMTMDDDISKMRTLHYCEDPIVDMILILKRNKAEKESIPMRISAVVPSDIAISKLDLSSIVSNMIDNAIEAAIRVKEIGVSPYVNMNIAVKGCFLIIRTENPTLIDKYIDDIDELQTTKDHGYGIHGYGLKILRSICGRYGGELIVEIKNHVSVFTMMMNCYDEGRL